MKADIAVLLKKSYPWLILITAIIAVNLFFKSEEPVHLRYVKGDTDTLVIPGRPDTVKIYLPWVIDKTVMPEQTEIITPDSSIYEFREPAGDSSALKIYAVTYPQTDSIRVNITGLNLAEYITRTDSFFISRTDTVLRFIHFAGDVPWYDNFITGAATALVTVTVILISLFKGL